MQAYDLLWNLLAPNLPLNTDLAVVIKGGIHHLLPKFEHIYVAVITFLPFFCADTFDNSLLLIVCALRWHVKSLYRDLFLEDTSKKARSLKKWHLPNWNMCNS